MSVAPSYVAVKRRRDEHPLSALVLEERQAKYRREHVEYRLQSTAASPSASPSANISEELPSQPAPGIAQELPRLFNLAPLAGRKRAADSSVDELPTFVERKRQRNIQGNAVRKSPTSCKSTPSQQQSTLLKRAGATTYKKPTDPKDGLAALEKEPSAELSDALHKFALEELARDEQTDSIPRSEPVAALSPAPRPAVKYLPKKAVPRLRDREPAVRIQDTDTEMNDHTNDEDDEAEYVYDIYVRHGKRAQTTEAEALYLSGQDNNATPKGSFEESGVLVITEQDEPLWQTYLEDDESDRDKEFETDEEDENAEGYYGADYPEDEVASDDDDMVGYRQGRGRNDEQWDHDADGDTSSADEADQAWKKLPWTNASREM